MIIAPSILAADFGRLAEQVARAERGGASLIHVDVMDGHFVPNLTVGPPVVRSLRKTTALPLDVHLMVDDANLYIDSFIDAGADWLSVHVEAVPHLHRAVNHIRSRGRRVGVALNPATPLVSIEEILPDLDYVLIMSVNPGFGGQSFIQSSLGKIQRLAVSIRERGLKVAIEVDGGVDQRNALALVAAGAEILVAGTAVFGEGDPAERVRGLLELGPAKP